MQLLLMLQRQRLFCCHVAEGLSRRIQLLLMAEMSTFNGKPTRWLGVWLDSHSTLKQHHAAWMKSARQVQGRIQILCGQTRMAPENCQRIQVACVQAVCTLWLRAMAKRRRKRNP